MNKQKALRTVDATLKALEALERALLEGKQLEAKDELWKSRRNLLPLNIMIERERDEHE